MIPPAHDFLWNEDAPQYAKNMGFLTPGPTVSFFGAAFASFSKRALYPRAQSEERQSDESF
jgi:hypothetical protein